MQSCVYDVVSIYSRMAFHPTCATSLLPPASLRVHETAYWKGLWNLAGSIQKMENIVKTVFKSPTQRWWEMKPQHQQDFCVWLSSPFFHTAKTVEAAELGVIVMFWTFLQNLGRGELGARRSGFWKDKEIHGKDGVGELDLLRGWTREARLGSHRY